MSEAVAGARRAQRGTAARSTVHQWAVVALPPSHSRIRSPSRHHDRPSSGCCRLEEEAALTRDAAAVAVEAEAAARRAALRASFTAENAALASTRAAAADAVKAAASATAASHVVKEEANPFLREDTRMAASALGAHRCVVAVAVSRLAARAPC